MKKQTKLFIAFILASISALVMPVFAQWYEQQTGIYPVVFLFVWMFCGAISIMLIALKDVDM